MFRRLCSSRKAHRKRIAGSKMIGLYPYEQIIENNKIIKQIIKELSEELQK